MEPNLNLARALALALSFASAAALAQSAPAGAGSTGNFPVITVPPPPMTSVANPPTPGADSTLWSNGIPGPQDSSVTIPLPTSPSGGGTPPPPAVQCTPGTLTKDYSVPCSTPGYVGQHIKACQVAETCPSGAYGPPSYGAPQNCVTIQQCQPPGGQSCTPGQQQLTQQASCPAGETVGGQPGGATSFTQTNTLTTTCPNGPNGVPSQTQSGWSPTVAAECAVPQNGGGQSQTCTVQCPVKCTLYKVGLNYVWTQVWLGGANCPVADTHTGNVATGNAEPAFCTATTETYTYTSTSSCP